VDYTDLARFFHGARPQGVGRRGLQFCRPGAPYRAWGHLLGVVVETIVILVYDGLGGGLNW